MIYSIKDNFACFLTPKCASTTIFNILNKQFELSHVGYKHDNRLFYLQSKMFLFASVRNPYSRAISGYYYYKKNNIPTDKIWESLHLISMTDYFTHILKIEESVNKDQNWKKYVICNRMMPEFDHLLRVEHLEEDIKKLPFIKQCGINCDNKTIYEKLDKKLVEDICSYVKTNYKDDFINFNYDIDVIPEHILKLVN